ncbi:hypothetical protein ACGFZK_17565 [Streptomyces sp. NPDC048257]|uniref:hypothetical protein n=1 Tax=Streptomyces sp. NPDC048257 TaxID=3365526 RepID=UPI003723FC54
MVNGAGYSQGSRTCFLDIIEQMEKRGRNPKFKSDGELAAELRTALKEGRLDYVVVKGQNNAGTLIGYTKPKFRHQGDRVTATVDRHGAAGPDDEAYAARMTTTAIEGIESLEDSPGMLDALWNSVRLSVAARSAVDPDGAGINTWEAVVNAAQVGSALFQVTGATRGNRGMPYPPRDPATSRHRTQADRELSELAGRLLVCGHLPRPEANDRIV